jgi:hypothetical protein
MCASAIAVASLLVVMAANARDSWSARDIAELSDRVFGGRKAFDTFRSGPQVTVERLHVGSVSISARSQAQKSTKCGACLRGAIRTLRSCGVLKPANSI